MDFEFLKEIDKVKLIVAGEVGIDEYIWGESRRISPEAPVPVVEVTREEQKLGLSANVAKNIISLGAKVKLISFKGRDKNSAVLEKLLKTNGIEDYSLIEDDSRPTLKKVRVISQKQHVVRIDYERCHKLKLDLSKKFVESICDNLLKYNGLIIQDYGKGIWTAETLKVILEAKKKKVPVFVDPSRYANPNNYRKVTFLTPNMIEAENLSGLRNPYFQIKEFDKNHLEKVSRKILTLTEAEHVIITCGKWGMVATSKNSNKFLSIPTFAREVYDVTGAGDTVIAIMSLIYLLNKPLEVCMTVANAGAGLVVGHVGTSSVTKVELKQELERLNKKDLIKLR